MNGLLELLIIEGQEGILVTTTLCTIFTGHSYVWFCGSKQYDYKLVRLLCARLSRRLCAYTVPACRYFLSPSTTILLSFSRPALCLILTVLLHPPTSN